MENTIQEVKKQPISMTEYVLNMVVNYAAVGSLIIRSTSNPAILPASLVA